LVQSISIICLFVFIPRGRIFRYISLACGRFSDSFVIIDNLSNSKFSLCFWGEFLVFFLAIYLLISLQNNHYSVRHYHLIESSNTKNSNKNEKKKKKKRKRKEKAV
jgi:hypothetical protein